MVFFVVLPFPGVAGVAGFPPVPLTGFVALTETEGFAVFLLDVPVPLDGLFTVGLLTGVAGFLFVAGLPCDVVPVEGLGATTVWPELVGLEGFGAVVTLWPEWFVVPVATGFSLFPPLNVRPLYQLFPPLLCQLWPPR